MTGLTVLPAEILTTIIKPFVDGLRYRGETDIFELMRVSRFCRDAVLIAWYLEDTSRWSTALWQRKAERMVQLEARALWDIEVNRLRIEVDEFGRQNPYRPGPYKPSAEEMAQEAKRASTERKLQQSLDAAVEAQQRLPAVFPKVSAKEVRGGYCKMIPRICAKQGHVTHRCNETSYDPPNNNSIQRLIDAQLREFASHWPFSGPGPALLPPEPDTST